MNQTALIVYLKNLRDLETARAKLKEILRNEQTAFEHEDEALRKSRYLRYYKVDLYRYFTTDCCVICAVCFSLAILLFRNAKNDTSFLLLALVCLMVGAARLVYAVKKFLDARQAMHTQNERARLHNHRERKKTEENEALRKEKAAAWENRRAYLNDEVHKVDKLLEDAYGLDLLPESYRNLTSVSSVYDYMCASNASLSEALQQDFGSVSANSADILKSRKIESAFSSNGSQTLGKELNKNIQQLTACCHEESDPALSAEYQKIADQYSQANDFFSLASYL
jgi:hypothetical protein